MSKTQMAYFEKEDILHVCISNGGEASSVELSPNITAELNENGDLIGIEILNASSYIRDAVMDGDSGEIGRLFRLKTATCSD